jgi:hypothetical protein
LVKVWNAIQLAPSSYPFPVTKEVILFLSCMCACARSCRLGVVAEAKADQLMEAALKARGVLPSQALGRDVVNFEMVGFGRHSGNQWCCLTGFAMRSGPDVAPLAA